MGFRLPRAALLLAPLGSSVATYVGCGLEIGGVGGLPDGGVPDVFVPDVHLTSPDTGSGDDAEANEGGDGDGSPPPVIRASCKEILVSDDAAASGVYVIDPDGDGGAFPELKVWCDMRFRGGGWTLVQTYLADSGGPTSFVVDAGVDAMFVQSEPAPWANGAFTEMVVRKLAAEADEVNVRSPFPDAGDASIVGEGNFIVSNVVDGGSRPVNNLRAGLVLNATGPRNAVVSEFNGPSANAATIGYDAGGPCAAILTARYPNIYWSCQNGRGFHIVGATAKWNYSSATNERFEVYVR